MKSLKEILYKTGLIEVVGKTAIDIHGISFNSLKITEGDLFVAIRGTKIDGHQFINDVITKGAKAIVCEEFPKELNDSVAYVKVKNTSIALGEICSNYYDNPSARLKLIGITGTNGKTTTATLLYRLFTELGNKCGLISTVEYRVGETLFSSSHTTPDPLTLNSLLNQMARQECSYCFMEVSSHAVVQYRIAGLTFSGGLFTNITHDHLDYHKTFDEYIKAKKGFFDGLNADAFALVNSDDRNSKIMLQNTKAVKKTFSMHGLSDFRCKVMENNFSGLHLSIDGNEVLCRLIGSFNAYNLLGVYGAAVLLGVDKINALTHLSNLLPPEGRFEYIVSENKITGIVDYAHTPDALKNVLNTISDIRTKNEKVITVVGCGGDRDKAKRPLMAKIACELSDKVILTSDNPRSEDPNKILEEMRAGVPAQHFNKTISISDRKEAVKAACHMAISGDIILVAGKGHEKYQEINGVKFPFDDKEVLQESFKTLGA